MPAHESLPFLREALLFLALAGMLMPLLQRLKINQVLGFLAAGVVVGPYGAGLWIAEHPWLARVAFLRPEGVAPLAELGVLFLMFMIGLELSAARLWALRRWVFGAGSAQVLLCATAIGLCARAFGNPGAASLLLGLVLSLSSTAVVMQLLSERRALGYPLGQAAFSILMLQDLAVVPIFILISVLSGGQSNWLPLAGAALAKSIGAILVIYLAGRPAVRLLLRTFLRQRQPDVFVALTLLIALGIAALTALAGLSLALGAFLAGLLLAETEFRHEMETVIAPFRSLLMGLFFLSVGMQTDLRALADTPLWLPLSVPGLFAIKAFFTGTILRIGGFSWGRALEGGLLLGQGGEFAFIVVGQAVAAHLMSPALGQFIMLVVAFSMFATPLAWRAGRAFGDWWQLRHPDTALRREEPLPEGHVVIVGFGRVGRMLAQILDGQGTPYVAIDNDPQLVTSLRGGGGRLHYGDAGAHALLKTLHAESAAAIVLTMDDSASALHTTLAIRRDFASVPIFARARDERHAGALLRAGATQVVPETLESGLQLSGFVLQRLGFPDSAAAQVIDEERERRIAQTRPRKA
ncbi:cation:proton antiporter domain-containing protein [Noviherbaspirillum pedocola]|uniref:Cation:proton antiporter n=1 Tax=Noviherbaspirillum pedocola TaxID=2801341 RepID=A0A934SNE9_9BURK|nr:cation:proton antiporter [Noviherbaspirillum pedocola]MBK4733756.1 cation:proton antiporter [Noviherbaspirillum pedocola]